MRRRVFATLVAVALFAIPASAQEQSGAMQGTIKDSQGGILPGVTVEAKNQATGAVQSTVTNESGIYRFPALAPGRYDLNANLTGFSPAKNPNVVLQLGQVLTIDLTMGIAGVAENVQVTAESPLIDVKQNASVAVVSAERIDRIPKGRNFTDVLAVVPGANIEARAGGVSVGGASGSENRFVVDGIDTTNLQNGSSGKTYVTDFIQEVQVKTAGVNAEYPGSTGGVVNAVTKTGTNTVHGSGGFYYRNNGPTGLGNKDKSNFWVGKQRATLRLNPNNTTLAEYVTTPLDENPVWEPVVEAGGPVMKDHLWYYAGYAPVRQHITRTVTWQTPAAGGPTTQTFTRDDPFDRLTLNGAWRISNSLNTRFGYNPQWERRRHDLPGIEPNGTSTSNASTDYDTPGLNTWNDSYSGILNWVARSNFNVEVQGGYFMYDQQTLGNGTDIRHIMNGNINVFPGVPADLNQPDGYADNRSTSKTVTDKQDRFYVNTTGTWFKHAFGEHAIKGGVRFERIGNIRDVGNIQPNITFHWDQVYTTSTGADVRGTYGYFEVSRGVLGVGNIHSNNVGLFIQDGWSISSRLTINAGVRTESERIPFYTPGEESQGIKFGFGDKIAPRVGFAYDVQGNGRWKAYGSFGRFFDIMKLELPRGSLGGEQWHIYYYPLNTLNWKSINCQEADPACPGTLIETSTLRFGSNEPDNPETAGVMTKYFGGKRNLLMDNMKPMTSQEFTFGLDHELTRVMSAGIRYQHKNVLHAIEDFGWNEGGTEFYFIGNPGEGYIGGLNFLWGQTNPATGFTPAPLYNPANTGGKVYPQVKPVRDYDSVEFRVEKRLANRWSAVATYQWSRLWGNYPGLASSDEAGGGTARLSPNVNRLYDGPWLMYDAHGNPVKGLLNTDRPHYFKVQPTYDFPWGTSIGLNWYIRSGALYSKSLSYQGYAPVFFDGRGTLGRTPVEQAADLLIQHDIKLGGNRRLNVNLNVFNLFDNDVATAIYDTPFRDRFTFNPVETFFNGFDPIAVAAAGTQRPDARYYGGVAPSRSVANFQNASPMDRIFLGRREVRFGMKITF
jgi:Carboxypeptidase regulatory-like domain/TonB-dependent Receptor Plug Domain